MKKKVKKDYEEVMEKLKKEDKPSATSPVDTHKSHGEYFNKNTNYAFKDGHSCSVMYSECTDKPVDRKLYTVREETKE